MSELIYEDRLEAYIEENEPRLEYDYEPLVYVNYGLYHGLNVEDLEVWKEEAESTFYGKFESDEEFAQNMHDEVNDTRYAKGWPYDHIDWMMAAYDLMFDYIEEGGYYYGSV